MHGQGGAARRGTERRGRDVGALRVRSGPRSALLTLPRSIQKIDTVVLCAQALSGRHLAQRAASRFAKLHHSQSPPQRADPELRHPPGGGRRMTADCRTEGRLFCFVGDKGSRCELFFGGRAGPAAWDNRIRGLIHAGAAHDWARMWWEWPWFYLVLCIVCVLALVAGLALGWRGSCRCPGSGGIVERRRRRGGRGEWGASGRRRVRGWRGRFCDRRGAYGGGRRGLRGQRGRDGLRACCRAGSGSGKC